MCVCVCVGGMFDWKQAFHLDADIWRVWAVSMGE